MFSLFLQVLGKYVLALKKNNIVTEILSLFLFFGWTDVFLFASPAVNRSNIHLINLPS
jgi:hypothetical protein